MGCLLHISLNILRTITQDLSPFTRAWDGGRERQREAKRKIKGEEKREQTEYRSSGICSNTYRLPPAENHKATVKRKWLDLSKTLCRERCWISLLNIYVNYYFSLLLFFLCVLCLSLEYTQATTIFFCFLFFLFANKVNESGDRWEGVWKENWRETLTCCTEQAGSHNCQKEKQVSTIAFVALRYFFTKNF